jgi:serine protease
MKKLLTLFILCALFATFSGDGFSQMLSKPLRHPGSEKWMPDEIVVKFKNNVPAQTIDRLNSRHGATVLSTSRYAGFKRIKVPQGKTPQQLVQEYEKEQDVAYAELNYLAYAMFIPNDSLFHYQWNFYNSVNGGIRANLAWDITAGAPTVIIAIVDTGIAYETYKNYQIAPELSEVHFINGYNFVRNNTHADDDDGHGTHVAGTLAQNTNNGEGTAGLAYNCSIMPVKVLDKRGTGAYTTIADGIYFAVDHGAKVVNLSLGGDADAATLQDACAYAYNHGVTIVCAAGNEYQSGNAPSYPAAYDDYVIAVGAVRFDKTRAYYSNTGSYLDIAAPGGDLNVDQNGDGYNDGILQQTFGNNPTDWGYWFYEGTSMATPHVTAVAAILLSQGAPSPDAVKQALQASAEDMGAPGWDPEYGWGVLDAFGALMYLRRTGDLTGDGRTDLADLSVLAANWLQDVPVDDIAPSGGDGIINFHDFAAMAQHRSQ